MKKIIILTIALLIACSTGTHRNYPPEIKSYSETVIVPGMSSKDLNMKLTLFNVQNGDFIYSAESGKYTATFDIQGNSPSEINENRKAAYAKAAKLRKDVYKIPLSLKEEENLSEKADQYMEKNRIYEAAKIFYNIAVANPQDNSAIKFYAAVIADNGQFREAIRILELIQDDEEASEMLADIRIDLNKKIAEEQAEREWQEMQRERQAEEARQRMAMQEEANETSWTDVMRGIADVMSATGQAMQKSSGSSNNASYQSQSSGGGTAASSVQKSSYNCSSAKSKYSKDEKTAKKDYETIKKSSSGEPSTIKRLNEVQKRMAKTRSEANKNGCNITMSIWENA